MGEYIMAIQSMLNDYLENTNRPTVREILEKNGQVEKYGELSSTHKIFLQQMIKEVLKKDGRNIDELLPNKQILGVLTSDEIKIVDELLTRYMMDYEIKDKIA